MMKNVLPAGSVRSLAVACALAAFATAARADSDPPPQLALDGYCPVGILLDKAWVEGSPEITAVFDGCEYRFPDEESRERFLADPERFAPPLNGDCVVRYQASGERVPGKIEHASFYDDRLYLFASARAKARFKKRAARYQDVDLAFAGSCPVKLIDDRDDVEGLADVQVRHEGLRYRFRSAEERDLFLMDPESYAVDSAAAAAVRMELVVSAEGKSACAFCDHGVRPLRNPGSLGMLVRSDDGTLYVLEEAEQRFPSLYAARFDGQRLQVKGRVLKRRRNVVWLLPSDVRPAE